MSFSRDYDFIYTKLDRIFLREGLYDVKYYFRTVFHPKSPNKFQKSLLMRGYVDKLMAEEGKLYIYIYIYIYHSIT